MTIYVAKDAMSLMQAIVTEKCPKNIYMIKKLKKIKINTSIWVNIFLKGKENDRIIIWWKYQVPTEYWLMVFE